MFNLIKVRPKQEFLKKSLRDNQNFENIYHVILEASAAFSVLPQDLNLASMEQFYKVFGPNSITNEQQTDKRAAPGPQEGLWPQDNGPLSTLLVSQNRSKGQTFETNQKRVFIPYIFKRGYEPTDDVFEPMEYDDMNR